MQLMKLNPLPHESFMFIYNDAHFELLTIFSYELELENGKPVYSELPLSVLSNIESRQEAYEQIIK